MAVSSPRCMAASLASRGKNKEICLVFRSLCSPYPDRRRNSIFIMFMLSPTSLFTSTRDIHRNNINNLHSAFNISSRRSQQNIYIDGRERRPLRPGPRRASSVLCRPHRFAGAAAMLLNLSRVEHVAPRHARITLRLLRLRNPAALSAFARCMAAAASLASSGKDKGIKLVLFFARSARNILGDPA